MKSTLSRRGSRVPIHHTAVRKKMPLWRALFIAPFVSFEAHQGHQSKRVCKGMAEASHTFRIKCFDPLVGGSPGIVSGAGLILCFCKCWHTS